MGQEQAVVAVQPSLRRRRQDVLVSVIGAVVLILTAIPIDAHDLSGLETDLFRLVNELPGALYGVVWPLMQFGNAIAVAVFALAALLARRARLAIAIAVSGLAVWLLAKVIKVVVERGRPAELLDDVIRRDAPRVGHGYPSGHAAVAMAIAVVVSPYLNRPWKFVLWTVAVAVCLGRVYVGAHLPLDVIAGAAFGLGVGALCNLALGTPDRFRTSRSAATGDA